jgi:hypothetical protein
MNEYALIRKGALVSLLGFIFSGPVAVVIVMLVAPQPDWSSAGLFVENFHVIQTIPYFLGFMLLAGILMLNTGLLLTFREYPAPVRIHVWTGYGIGIVFLVLVAFNYICQTTFIPHLVKTYDHTAASLIASFSMSNPNSLSWALEMRGYAFLGASNWLMASCYKRQNRTIYMLLKSNFIVSLGSLVWAIADAGWVNTFPGLILFFAWNVLMMFIVALIYRHTHSS